MQNPKDNSLNGELPPTELLNVLGEIKQLLEDRSNLLKTIPCDVSVDVSSALHSSIQPELPFSSVGTLIKHECLLREGFKKKKLEFSNFVGDPPSPP